ncbi:MAG: T9SS type A sorting domain-containing protein [Saprospirales bacterium]|nr:T9SS type A sorting domain-containing protein [Saprospirales bacterium]
MKLLTIVLLLLLGWPLLFAQNILVADPDSLFLEDQMADLSDPWKDFNMNLKLKNGSGDTLEVVWKREIGSDCPLEWEFFVSDIIGTYIPTVSMSPEGAQFNVPSQGEAYFGIHVLPNTVEGCCTVLAIFSDYNNPGVVFDTAYFHITLNSDCLPSSVEPAVPERLTVEVYPNPASGEIYVSSAGDLQFEITDPMGILVKTGKVEPLSNTPIDIRELRDGVYFIRFYDEKKGRRQLVKFLKMTE